MLAAIKFVFCVICWGYRILQVKLIILSKKHQNKHVLAKWNLKSEVQLNKFYFTDAIMDTLHITFLSENGPIIARVK